MSIAKFFSPYCIKPTYLINTSEESVKCGFINGLFYSFVFTVIILLVGFKFYGSETDITRKSYIMYGMGISIGLLWILCPIISYYTHKTLWTGYNDSKIELQKRGYSKMEILNILQLYEQGAAPINIGGIPTGVFLQSKTRSTSQIKNEKNNINDKLSYTNANTDTDNDVESIKY